MKLRLTHVALLVLFGLNAYVWFMAAHAAPPTLRVSVLDIGQGDSILIQGPTGIQMLVDGGPDDSVLRQLPKEMSLLDRSIDLIVETHPDKDHIAGLTSVFNRYQVSYFLRPGIEDSTSYATALEHAASIEPGIHELIARRGMRIHLGGGAYADVLYPDHDVTHSETNEGSIVMRVVYGSTSFMLTGDAPSDIEDHLIALGRADAANATHAASSTTPANPDNILASTVLKAGHHGSKYSTDDAWLAVVHPAYVAISAGANNRYGHPNPETLTRIQHEGASIESTITSGTIRYVSDGSTVWVR